MPVTKAKGELITKLLPAIAQPGGDAARGKQLFTGTCASCHRLGDVGQSALGPPLTGMGTHGRAELLAQILDPNREVDPSYWQWDVTTKKGETLAGVIARENQAGITLRTLGGDVELKKEEIATPGEHAPLDDARGLRGARRRDAARHPRLHGGGQPRHGLPGRGPARGLHGRQPARPARGGRARRHRRAASVRQRHGRGRPVLPHGSGAVAARHQHRRPARRRAPGGTLLDQLPRSVEIPVSATASSLHFLGGRRPRRLADRRRRRARQAGAEGDRALRRRPDRSARARERPSTSPTWAARRRCRSAGLPATSPGAASCATSRSTSTAKGPLSKVVLEAMDGAIVPGTVALTLGAEPAAAAASARAAQGAAAQAPGRCQPPAAQAPARKPWRPRPEGRRQGRRAAAGNQADHVGGRQDEGPDRRGWQFPRLRTPLRWNRRRDAARRRVRRQLHRGSRPGGRRAPECRRRRHQRQPPALRHAGLAHGGDGGGEGRQGAGHDAPRDVVRVSRTGRS